MADDTQTLGEYFRSEREKRGLDLKEIEERTKISAQTLVFLEEDRLDMLPPRAFLRGFLRVISKEFDFDEEELLSRLERELSAHERGNRAQRPQGMDYQARPMKTRILVAAVAAIVVLVVILLSLGRCSRDASRNATGSMTEDPIQTPYASCSPRGWA